MAEKDQIERAVEALKQYVAQVEAKKKPDLLQDDQYVYLTGSYKKPRPSRITPRRILLPHPLNEPERVDICIFTKDTKPEVKKLLEEKGIKWTIKVIPIRKINISYKSYERKKALAGMYDVFLADRRIFSLLRHKLGKAFIFKRGIPYPVNLHKADLKSELHSAVGSAYHRTNDTTSLTVRFGKVSMVTGHLVDNAMTLISNIVSHTPRGWSNITSLYLKTSDSIALPIYNSLDLAPPTKIRAELDPEAIIVPSDMQANEKIVNKYSTKRIKGSKIIVKSKK
jgi:ribosome biogenesis protein UTP30